MTISVTPFFGLVEEQYPTSSTQHNGEIEMKVLSVLEKAEVIIADLIKSFFIIAMKEFKNTPFAQRGGLAAASHRM